MTETHHTTTDPRVDAATGDVETGHEYDGIREFDNPLPKWWLATFWGAIVFAVVYWFVYHTLGTLPDSHERYAMARQAHDEQMMAQSMEPEELVAMSEDEEAVAKGAEHFEANCVACHGPQAEGKIGPNLTDNAWIHGGSPEAIWEAIAKGVTEKGMPAWGPTLGPEKVKELTAYVLSIRNTNVEGKAPEGEPYAAAAGK
ncbi:MAG: cbb3-type cytochrome c oxidase N-terminal domain-containing protein [Myxococcota bacterium]